MSASTRRTIWFIAVPLFLVAGLVLLVVWGVPWLLAPTPSRDDATPPPPARASVSLPSRPNSLAWSADGNYLAAGTWGQHAVGETGPADVFILDVAKASVLTTLQATNAVEALAFSPDGKWLAVGPRPSIPAGPAPVELVVFDVPAFTVKFTAKASRSDRGFVDLAWAPDSKSLSVIDGPVPVDAASGESEVRRWEVPAFTEQPVIGRPELKRPVALAVSPDGRTLALGEQQGAGNTSLLIRLFDLGKGAEQSSFSISKSFHPPRLGFTADGKAVGVFERINLSWWDVATGRPAQPGVARFTVQPAGLTYPRCSAAVSLDGNWQAHGYERHRGLGDLGWDNRAKEFGTFIKVTDGATATTWTWRVSAAQLDTIAVAFSPDGKKLAATVWQPSGGSIEIWAVPE
jgi:WD40 repeat protein